MVGVFFPPVGKEFGDSLPVEDRNDSEIISQKSDAGQELSITGTADLMGSESTRLLFLEPAREVDL